MNASLDIVTCEKEISNWIPDAVISTDRLTITNVHPPDKAFCSLCKYLKTCPVFSELVFSSNHLSEKCLRALCSVIKVNRSIVYLDLSDNVFNGHAFSLLCSAVAKSSISTLIIDNTDLTSELVSSFSSLSSYQSLQALSCENNGLDDDGFRHLLFFLRRCSSLMYLSVSHNHITGKVLPFIADFLENAHCLKHIDLSGVLMERRVVDSFRKLTTATGCEFSLSEDTENHQLLEEQIMLMRQLSVMIVALTHYVGVSPPESILLSEEELKKKLEYERFPSLLVNAFKQIESHIKRVIAVKMEGDSMIPMIVHYLALFLSVLETPPVNHYTVENWTFDIPSSIVTTVGPIERCGMLRVCVVSLFACLLSTDDSVVIEEFLHWNVSYRVLYLLFLYPWNSALHQAWITFFTACFQSEQSLLWRHVLEEDCFLNVVTQAIHKMNEHCSETMNCGGYSGAVIAVCLLLQRIEEKNPVLHEILMKQQEWEEMKDALEEWKKRQHAYARPRN